MVVSPYCRLIRGLHHCTTMEAEFEFQQRGLIGGLIVWKYGVLEILWACICVFLFQLFFFFWLLALNSRIYIFFCYVCHVLHITKSKNLCSRKHEFVWDKEVRWFFCVQVSICRSKNLIGVSLAYNEHLPLLWFYMHLLTL